jgi:hypothetical protein
MRGFGHFSDLFLGLIISFFPWNSKNSFLFDSKTSLNLSYSC